MSRADDQTYYTSRTEEELERGDQANNAAVAAVHYELAHRYSARVAQSGAEDKLELTFVPGGNDSAPSAPMAASREHGARPTQIEAA